MSKIDWSKAPEWADGHGLVAHHGITEAWINMDQYAVVGAEDRAYPYGGGAGETRHNFTRGQVQYITPRPARWDGEGLPPIGQKIEMKNKRSTEDWARPGFQEVTITAMGAQLFLVTYRDGGEENCGHLSEYDFRPLSSPEQRAAEERQRAARQMCLDAGHESPTPGQINMGLRLYDAGYRKQVEQ
ncbi:hypothetical protein [Pseudomonas sp. NBRC 111133]|uniref:hypothetical protein n=1 Tax=Pseudomonas sp. NBRC 111133 TaxID=1661048 RepID=UPI00076140AA|nr:hypothetical protein [Pseudomonas sp. NBRC 111133]